MRATTLMRMTIAGLSAGALAVVIACGGGLGPAAPTRKTVTAQDVIGTWTVDNSTGDYTITVTFNPDGSFSQSIKDKATRRASNQPGGRWSVQDNHILLDHYVSAERNESTSMSWYMIGGEPSGPLVLYGGDHGDPDSFRPMEKVGETRPKSPTGAP